MIREDEDEDEDGPFAQMSFKLMFIWIEDRKVAVQTESRWIDPAFGIWVPVDFTKQLTKNKDNIGLGFTGGSPRRSSIHNYFHKHITHQSDPPPPHRALL